jgi:riboflavin biosynthesis pyrimidine reductase
VDKFRLLYAPKLIGAEGLSSTGPLGLEGMADAVGLSFRDTAARRIGDDILLTAYPCSPD